MVLCNFNDVPVPNIARSRFSGFVSQLGRGGLYDFWRDVSYGNLDLAGSEVFGWYTMKYSFVLDGADHFKNGKQGRSAWIVEAIRLAGANSVDLSKFYGVMAVVNANVDDSNWGRNTALCVGGSWGQTNWRWCQKCQGLCFGGHPASVLCPTGGAHDLSASWNYALSIDEPTYPGQDNWRWCNKCEGLVYNGGPSPGPCPAGAFHDLSQSANYRLGSGKVGHPGQALWKWCQKCQGLGFSGSTSPGACAAGGVHDYSASANYTLVHVDSGLIQSFNAHETGHCYTLQHSWSANPDVEYGDSWDIMSAMNVKTFDNKQYAPAGPGLNSPNLYKMGWLPDSRVFTSRASPSGTGTKLFTGHTLKLVALNRPEIEGFLMARVLTSNHVYTVEFRQATGWDAGIGRDAVLIHELRSNYTTGQNNWRWCEKCQGLTYTGGAVCPAGGVHDHAESGNYRVAINDAAFDGQHSWRWCRKCQGLVFGGGATGPCPAEGTHDLAKSADYGLATKPGSAGQNQWKWCHKCQGLTFAGASRLGACPAGGTHDHSGSSDYTIPFDTSGPGQDQWRWCSKCQALAYDGYSVCSGGGSHRNSGSGDYSIELNDPGFPGQNLWKWCKKCYGLAFSGGTQGRCQAGGDHDLTASGDYNLLHDAGNADGQNQWRDCAKCHLLAFAGNGAGPCPGGGTHEHAGSADYTLANFAQDRTFLIQGDFVQGQEFLDSARGVRIAIDAIDSAHSNATITIGKPTLLSASVDRNSLGNPMGVA